MTQRGVTLNASKAGITRLRTKGGASPESLYDLSNGFVNASRCPQQRPGTTWLFNFANSGHTGNAGLTRGLVAFKGIVYTFCHTPLTSGSGTYQIITLRHPTSTTATLSVVHYAAPFMGFLYVVAEFSDTKIFDYWLQLPAAWQQGHKYNANDLVQPTVPNGFYYKAQQKSNPNAWTPLLLYKIGDVVQPTTYNGFQYTVYAEAGSGTPPARSGPIEPTFKLSIGSLTLDFSSSTPPPEPAAAPDPPPAKAPGTDTGGRYSNPANGPRSGGFAQP
jgi:hypothetical protein